MAAAKERSSSENASQLIIALRVEKAALERIRGYVDVLLAKTDMRIAMAEKSALRVKR